MDGLGLAYMLGSLGIVADLESTALGMRKQVVGIWVFSDFAFCRLYGKHALCAKGRQQQRW